MANWWDSAPLVEPAEAPAAPAGDWWQSAPIVEQPAATPQPNVAAEPSMLGDVAKSLGSGIVRGASSLVGIKGDLDNIVGSGVEWAGRKMGLPEPPPVEIPQSLLSPTSSQVTQAIENNITGPLHEPETTPGAYARTLGEFLPGMLFGPGSMARKFITQSVLPALASETAGQATEGSKMEPYARMAGAILGSMSPNVARRAVTPLPADPYRTAAVQRLENEGVSSLTAGQKTGNRKLQYTESEIGGSKADQMLTDQAEQFTSAALKRIGENEPRATTDVLARAGRRIGGDFDRLAASTTVPLDQRLQHDLMTTVADYQATAGMPAPVVRNAMDRIAEVAANNGGVLQGEAYQNIRSWIGKRISMSDGPTQMALREIQESLDDAVSRYMPPDQLSEWQKARRQYRNLLVIEKAATGAGSDAALGLISPAKLRQAAVGQNRRAYVRGLDDFSDLTHAGQAVMTPLPQSGTAPRSWARGITSAIGAGAGAAMGSPAGLWGAGLGAPLGAAIGPSVLGRVVMAKPIQEYLANQRLAAASSRSALTPTQRAALAITLAGGPRLMSQ